MLNFSYKAVYLTEFNMTTIRYSLHLKRRYLYFVINMLVPILILSILNSVTFFIPLESRERIQYSLTLFLAFTVFLTIFEKMMPQNSTAVPYISVYVGFQLLLCVISTVVSVVATSEVKKINDKDTTVLNSVYLSSKHETLNSVYSSKKHGTSHGDTSTVKVGEMESDRNLNNSKSNCSTNDNVSSKHRFHLECTCKPNVAMLVFNTISQVLAAGALCTLYWV